ncbi:MAG: phasin family protein [Pseudomonadota bacterium]
MPKAAKSQTPQFPFPMMNGDTTLSPEAMKEGMERMMALASEMTEMQREGYSAVAESARVSAKGMQEANARSLAFFQTAMGTMMEASKSIAGVKSVQEAVEMQANFSKAAMETYMTEANAVATLMAETMREAAEPLNAHAGQFVEKLNAVK